MKEIRELKRLEHSERSLCQILFKEDDPDPDTWSIWLGDWRLAGIIVIACFIGWIIFG